MSLSVSDSLSICPCLSVPFWPYPFLSAGEQCVNLEETTEETDINLSARIDELGAMVGIERISSESDSGLCLPPSPSLSPLSLTAVDLLDRIYKVIRFFSPTSHRNGSYIEQLENFPLGFDTGGESLLLSTLPSLS
jgi:hypothetical protein